MKPDKSITPRIAIFAAMPWECRPVLRHLRQVSRKRVGAFTVWQAQVPRAEVTLIKTGVGPQQATAAANALLASQCFDAVLSTGCAGGLHAAALPGDLVVATTAVCGSTGERFATDTQWTSEVLTVATRHARSVQQGPMLCVEQALATAQSKSRAAADGNVAVEMEGAAIARCAAAAKIPYAAMRAILDAADTELETDTGVVDPHSGALRPLGLAKYIVRRPAAVSRLLSMQRMMQAAQASLDRFFAEWLAAPSQPSPSSRFTASSPGN